MTDATPIGTPLEQGIKLNSEMSTKSEEEQSEMQRYPYRSLIGSLMYTMVCTRPDISTATEKLNQFLANPGLEHWQAAKRVLYLTGTLKHGLYYHGPCNGINGYVDSDGDIVDKKSTCGYVLLMASELGKL
ncbi:hypothetical protein O6H91_16G056300 [Diphasiastrum complanatum]|uniref:Uncharacterized protein n=1 Tax=Diphasiastrum complanatum TaxID=34168 RepID=A0ACC2BCG4_DIPCM|nr:hypothetical protein O6H91_16G056300 [Diphasiastrum complanatum]